jgi:hypothetical protein
VRKPEIETREENSISRNRLAAIGKRSAAELEKSAILPHAENWHGACS